MKLKISSKILMIEREKLLSGFNGHDKLNREKI